MAAAAILDFCANSNNSAAELLLCTKNCSVTFQTLIKL